MASFIVELIKIGEAAEVMQSGLEFLDPTGGIYMSGFGYASGTRSGTDFALALGLGAIHLHHPWPKYLGGAVDQELMPLGRDVHLKFHAGLDDIAPRSKGTKFYDKMSAEQK